MKDNVVVCVAPPLVAEIVKVCFPVWRLVVSLLYGSMPKEFSCEKTIVAQ